MLFFKRKSQVFFETWLNNLQLLTDFITQKIISDMIKHCFNNVFKKKSFKKLNVIFVTQG
jgi:hypothetical protein